MNEFNKLRDRYQILRQLGEGSFGVTYLAKDYDLPGEPLCVVKHLRPKTSNPKILEIAKQKFDREAQILYRLGNMSSQIPQLFAHFEEQKQFYLVQELVDGYDLTREVYSNKAQSEGSVLRLLKEILEVLAFVHQQNVIHRDIKPANIMRRRKDGKIVLIDFGAVKEVTNLELGSEGKISPTVSIGTPGYMPSEQLSGYPQFSSDIYSVGIIAFQALTELYRSPQTLPRDSSTGELHCDLFPQCKDINPAFAEVLNMMVCYDYRLRYQNASVALRALNNISGSDGESTRSTEDKPNTPFNNSGFESGVYNNPVSNNSVYNNPVYNNPVSNNNTENSSLIRTVVNFFQNLLNQEKSNYSSGSNSHPNFSPNSASDIPSEPGSDFEQPEGQVSLNSALYIPRPPIEFDCYQTIIKPGSLIRIKAPRQMGKTSLLSRTLNYARKQGCLTASLDFQSADADFFDNLDKFLKWFCGSIAQELDLPDKLDQYWEGVLGSKNKCTNYFQRYLLSEVNKPIVLGLDEIDQLFQHPQVAAEFFALLRAWHEKSKNQSNWQKLRLAIVHSKEVYIPLHINQSPFNVGLPVDLPEFNHSQVKDLVGRHGLEWSDEEVRQLMVMLGGHPYLVRMALYEISRQRTTLSKLLRTAPTEQGMFYDHLRRHLYNLKGDEKLVQGMQQAIASNQSVRLDTGLSFKLRSMGLVKFYGNNVTPLCNLYRLYFQEHLR